MMNGEMNGASVTVSINSNRKPIIRNSESGRFMQFQGPLCLHVANTPPGRLIVNQQLMEDAQAMSSLTRKKSV